MKKTMLFSVILVLLITLVGCGASTPQKKADTSSASSSASTTATTAKKATTLDKIKKNGYIQIAMTGKFPPFNFLNKKDELDGFDVDIAKEIAKRLGVKAKLVTTEWPSLIAGEVGGKYDVILSSMAITAERQKKIDFVPYYVSGAAVILPKDSKIGSPKELKGVKVGVGQGTTYEKKARALGADVVTYSASPDAFADMINGRIQAVISDKLLSQYAIVQKKYPFKVLDELLYTEHEGIAERKDSPELKQAIHDAMHNMFKDGTYTTISKKWFGIDIRGDINY